MRVLVFGAVFVVLTGGVVCWAAEGNATPLTEKTLEAVRKQAAQKPRRIIVNNDGNDVFRSDASSTPEGLLIARSTALVGTQVDAIFYCTGVFNLHSHKSSVSELQKAGDRGKKSNAEALIEQGTDTLEIMTKFGHANGMEVFWSMRMNDTHDSADDALLCQWKRDHPDYLMGKKGDKLPYGGHRWSAVNYELPEVREKVFRIFEDVCRRYDVDGVEMDFFRHPVYFKPQMTGAEVTQAHCDMMTALLARIRKMTEQVSLKRGRPMLVAVRVPDSTRYAKAIGLDVTRWLEDGLIDIVTGGGYFRIEPWQNLVALAKPYGVPVYAGLSASRIKGNIEVWRGEALNAWNAGVSGIYTFNKFNPKDAAFRELGDPKALAAMKSTYKYNAGSAIDYWLKDGKRFVVGE